jgi:hypothetical protein
VPFPLETVTHRAHEEVARQFPGLVPQYNDDFSGRNVTLFGSFSPENWARIKEARSQFQQLGFFVLAPNGETFTHRVGDFDVLDGDAGRIQHMERTLGRSLHPREISRYLEILFQMAMDRADVCYLVTDERGGYMGVAASAELGRVLGGKPILASAPINPGLDERDGYYSNFSGFVSGLYTASPSMVATIINDGGCFVTKMGVTSVVKGAQHEY